MGHAKSDIHSTDTHGYSAVIFGVVHLLGFSYAPRIKNLKKQNLYIYKSRKKVDRPDWKITPDKYVLEREIKNNWDQREHLNRKLRFRGGVFHKSHEIL
jgi:TnpA family transposase